MWYVLFVVSISILIVVLENRIGGKKLSIFDSVRSKSSDNIFDSDSESINIILEGMNAKLVSQEWWSY